MDIDSTVASTDTIVSYNYTFSHIDSLTLDSVFTVDTVYSYSNTYNYDTTYYNDTTTTLRDTLITFEYYISATSNNGKTITKPMTASQGGYYNFSFGTDAIVDSSWFDYDTTPMPMENITFTFGNTWVTEDNNAPRPIGIDEVENAEQNFGQFYPNPAADQANLNINLGDGGNYTVSIIDLSGRTVHTSSLQTAGQIVYTINTSRLASGIYHVVFQNGDTRVSRKLIVK
jgi:hypothetical protein